MRMLQIILLLGLSPFIFGQDAEFFGCCMFKEVQGTTMMVDRYFFLYGDAGNDDGRMAKMKTRVTSPSEMEVYHRDTRNITVHKWLHEMI